MERKAKCIEVRNQDGKNLLNLYLFLDTDVIVEERPEVEVVLESEIQKEKGDGSSPRAEDSLMTVAQKRFLFRILADQGIEGDEAHEHLRKLFEVDTLKEVSKLEASGMIERLLEENKNKKGEKHDRSPF
jgi:hypothetical protein